VGSDPLRDGPNLEEISMKRYLLCASLLALTSTLFAQQKPPASPPETASATIGSDTITIKYSSPGVKGREGQIFSKDGLIQKTHKQYPIWRAGANSATTLHTDADITIGTVNVPKGDYTLFVDVSDPDHWTLIVNKQTGEWGLHYDGSQDLGKTPMTMSKPPAMVENLIWKIAGEGANKGTLSLGWEDHSASVPVTVH
jgi:hypothetical protein